jgi:hypothetical protein
VRSRVDACTESVQSLDHGFLTFFEPFQAIVHQLE